MASRVIISMAHICVGVKHIENLICERNLKQIAN